MNLPAALRIENGPIGSALGTWLDFAPAGIATRFLLLWFVILWLMFNVLSHASTGLDSAILVNQSPAKRRQGRAATVRSALLGRDDRLAKAIVHIIDQEPCPAI